MLKLGLHKERLIRSQESKSRIEIFIFLPALGDYKFEKYLKDKELINEVTEQWSF